MPTATAQPSKRQQIVETAYGLFKSAGYHATGIDRIIAESNVAKMTMYRNFPSKDSLIVEVLRYRATRFEAQLDGLAATGEPAERKIATIIDWYERWFQSADFHGCLFAHALAEFGDPGHPVFAAVADQKNAFRHRLQRILAVDLPSDRAEIAAASIFMLLEGATLLAQMGQGDEAIRNVRDAAGSILAVPPGRR